VREKREIYRERERERGRGEEGREKEREIPMGVCSHKN
jgi:hypothetical protein